MASLHYAPRPPLACPWLSPVPAELLLVPTQQHGRGMPYSMLATALVQHKSPEKHTCSLKHLHTLLLNWQSFQRPTHRIKQWEIITIEIGLWDGDGVCVCGVPLLVFFLLLTGQVLLPWPFRARNTHTPSPRCAK